MLHVFLTDWAVPCGVFAIRKLSAVLSLCQAVNKLISHQLISPGILGLGRYEIIVYTVKNRKEFRSECDMQHIHTYKLQCFDHKNSYWIELVVIRVG